MTQTDAFQDENFLSFQQDLLRRAIAQESMSVTQDDERSLLLAQYKEFLDQLSL